MEALLEIRPHTVLCTEAEAASVLASFPGVPQAPTEPLRKLHLQKTWVKNSGTWKRASGTGFIYPSNKSTAKHLRNCLCVLEFRDLQLTWLNVISPWPAKLLSHFTFSGIVTNHWALPVLLASSGSLCIWLWTLYKNLIKFFWKWRQVQNLALLTFADNF